MVNSSPLVQFLSKQEGGESAVSRNIILPMVSQTLWYSVNSCVYKLGTHGTLIAFAFTFPLRVDVCSVKIFGSHFGRLVVTG